MQIFAQIYHAHVITNSLIIIDIQFYYVGINAFVYTSRYYLLFFYKRE